jgi:hypothetical protein
MWEGTCAACLPISVVTHGKHFETENLSSSQVATFHLFDAARFLTPDLRAGAVGGERVFRNLSPLIGNRSGDDEAREE